MAVAAINLARVSFNQRAINLMESIRANQTDMYRVQNHLATGLRFLQPSEDPVGAAAASALSRKLELLGVVRANLNNANATLDETDVAMQDALNLLTNANTIAVQSVGDTVTEAERHALVDVVDSLLEQMVSVGNRRFLNTYLFSGRQVEVPFELVADGVLYRGDADRMETIIESDLSQDSFTIPGMEFFGAVSAGLRGAVDLDPALTSDTRISDLDGALGRGVTLGRILVTVGNEQAQIDLRGAATVGDVVDKLNAELPGGLVASVGTSGIQFTRAAAGDPVTVSAVAGEATVADLGLEGTFGGATRAGTDIRPRLTLRTRMADLQAGSGLDLRFGFVIRNGARSATITLDDAETIEDVLNRINEAGVAVWARLADDGRTLELRSRISGPDLYVEEVGGRAATELGLRSLSGSTSLAELNDGLGIHTTTGNDLRITTRDGTTIAIDLDGASTLQDVIDLINTGAAGAVTAALVKTGNGLILADQTAGAGTFSVADIGASQATQDLGLDVAAAGNQLVGRDVNPVRVDSPFTALVELSRGMAADDRLGMQLAAERIERVLTKMQQAQGAVATLANTTIQRIDRVEKESAAMKVLLSDVRDVDFADAAVRFQQLQMALQANLSTAMQVMNLSVLDYLR